MSAEEQNNQEKRREGNPAEEANTRNRVESLLWLFLIVSISIIVLQGLNIINWIPLKGTWAVTGLALAGMALAATTVKGYLQNSKLKQSLKRLTEQQRKRYYPVTFEAGEESDNAADQTLQSDAEWTEKVKFTAVIEERQRLARELHDAVSQQLFAISMTATAVSRTIERDWERARRQVQLIEEMAAVAQSEMRALLLHLRPVHLDGKNLGQALSLLVEELKQKVPMEIKLEVDESILLPAASEDHLFRIAQEALSNTLRHSKAESMSIKLFRLDHKVHMTLQDSGIGFDLEAKKQSSYGLLTMEERVMELGGGLQVITQPGEGTTIHLWVPIEP
jgi:NarL family two-component system sensor histidine kinase LiaS